MASTSSRVNATNRAAILSATSIGSLHGAYLPRARLGPLPQRRATSTIMYNRLRALASVSANATRMEKQIVTLHIRVSERVASGLKQLAAADHRKLSPYIGLVLER